MSDPSERKMKLDVVLVVLLMGVAIAGFWMTGYAMNAQMQALEYKLDVVQLQTKAAMRTTAELQDLIRQMRNAQTPAPAVAVVPVAPAPKKP